ncbi:MAG: hypothetical protein RL499_830, partial [Actinomycetota bacterium]
MDALEKRLRAFGGIATVRELGVTPTEQRALARAVTKGDLLRLRTGVYALPDAHADVLRAAQIGGRLTGVSALEHHGLWVPPVLGVAELHVEARVAVTVRRECPPGLRVRVHWTRKQTDPQFGVAPLSSVLQRAAADLPHPFAVAVLDSALRSTPLTPVALLLDSASWRPRARAAAALTDGRSESGTESVLRVLLREAGIHSTPQAHLPLGGNQRADLLIGDRLLIECDSEAHHAEPARRRADLRRDESLVALGFVVVRLDYRQVFDDPAGVVATIAAIVARGQHLSA